MGRLVKASSNDGKGEQSLPDEAQFLRDSGALAARIRQELQDEADQERSRERSGSSASASANRQLGRDVYSQLDVEWARMSDSPAIEGVAQEGLRIFTGSDEPVSSPENSPAENSLAETSEPNAGADAIRRELMEELAQEQSRWTERHAMQVRSIEEQSRQLEQADAEVERREQELDRRERELDAKARELASKAETEVRSRISRDWESTQEEMARLASEVRVHADRASQFEAELTEVRREHAIELDGLRGQLNQHDNSRTDRARSVIDECDQRMAELAAQRAAWQAEQSRRREEFAHERLEQRDEVRKQQESQLTELTTLRKEFEKERDATVDRLDRERREWNQKFTREQDELLDLKQATETDAERERAKLAREKAEWEIHQEHMRTAVREEQRSAQELLNARMTDADRLQEEHTAKFDRLTKELDAERATWHRERGEEAAILHAERSELDTEADRLRAERSLIETERQQLVGELERQRAEHDENLRESWRSHQASLQRVEQESSNRQRVITENQQQQQNELAARMKQAEHEIRSARELNAKQIAQAKERFSQNCATHEAELERGRAELNVQRQKLEREKLDFADESARARTQAEQERTVIRNSLSQMDAQLRTAATSLLQGSGLVVASQNFAEELVSSETRTEAATDEVSRFEIEAEADGASAEGVPSESFDSPVATTLADSLSAAVQNSVDEDTVVEEAGWAEPSEEYEDEQSIAEEQNAEAWEPGKEATLVETTSSDLIRRFDTPSETGGVAGLTHRPRIASHGVLAQATSDALAAEIVYDESDRQTEWVGTVETRTDELIEAAVSSQSDTQNDGRRQALESYRSKLSSLQDQLRQLSQASTVDSESEFSDDE